MSTLMADEKAVLSGPWKTGREDIQSYTGDGQTALTNIYHTTVSDGVHEPTGSPLPLTIGRAEGEHNKAIARLIAAAPDMLELLKKYAYDGHLQSFEDRERFRKDALALIAKADGRS